jgi:azurin
MGSISIKATCCCLLISLCICGRQSVKAQVRADTLTIKIQAVAGMQYDPVRFSVSPGSWVKLILANTDEMDHNLIIGKKQSREKIVSAAMALGARGMTTSFVPQIPEVLWHIPLIHGEQADSIIFRVPRATGVYPYVCTFPGHGNIMYGAMHVTNGLMPSLAADLHIPPHRRVQKEDTLLGLESGHPFALEPPYLYRVLMPDASPAAIAVALPNQLSYCWDAGVCRLRYVWYGPFLDLQDYWTVKGELYAKILGEIIYRDEGAYPLLVGVDAVIPEVQFKGYRLVNNYPEFQYVVSGMDVFEKIMTLKDGSGLTRQFQIVGATEVIWFTHEPDDGIIYSSDKGVWVANRLRLTPQEAAAFNITMMMH